MEGIFPKPFAIEAILTPFAIEAMLGTPDGMDGLDEMEEVGLDMPAILDILAILDIPGRLDTPGILDIPDDILLDTAVNTELIDTALKIKKLMTALRITTQANPMYTNVRNPIQHR
jgi:hypothetical protein